MEVGVHLRYFFHRLIVKESGGERSVGKSRAHLSPALALLRKAAVPVPRFSLIACVAGVRKGRGRELARPTRSLARPNSLFPFPFNAGHAGYLSVTTALMWLMKYFIHRVPPVSLPLSLQHWDST